jgi:hypothetical protein
MIKQAKDLCESQYQLDLMLAESKLPASSVWHIKGLRIYILYSHSIYM